MTMTLSMTRCLFNTIVSYIILLMIIINCYNKHVNKDTIYRNTPLCEIIWTRDHDHEIYHVMMYILVGKFDFISYHDKTEVVII